MIWNKIPEHLTDDQKAVWKKASFRVFELTMGLLKSLLFLCVLGLLYGIFGSSLSFFKKPAFSQETYMAQQKKRLRSIEMNMDKIENGIHLQTGLVYGKGFKEVRATCTACHSAQLVTQNRATREGWESMIRWMQQTQGLWDLGAYEPIILDYLAEHYAPQELSRRPNLDTDAIKWYVLELE